MKSSTLLLAAAAGLAAWLLLKQPKSLQDRVQAGDEVEFLSFAGLPPEASAALSALGGSPRFSVLSADSQSLQVRPTALPTLAPFMMARSQVSAAYRNGQALT